MASLAPVTKRLESAMTVELALVMPVHNRESSIAAVVNSWLGVLSLLNADFHMIILDDGSTDGTLRVLKAFADDERIEIVTKPNSGHGPTILMGYRKACRVAEWVFQCDGDAAMSPEVFPELWERREKYEALLGRRTGRREGLAGRFVGACSRSVVRLLFGRGISDVNTPYRLMRADVLKEIVEQIPSGASTPNVIISGALIKAKAHLLNYPVPHCDTEAGRGSIVRWGLWTSAAKSLFETLRCRPSIAPIHGGGDST